MHLLVADFGSSKILPDDYNYEALQSEVERHRQNQNEEEEDNNENSTTSTRRKRRVSFVGTAQYVSPEVLNGDAAHPAIDLFSYASIVYQMICGRFAFDAGSEYLTFQKILKLDYHIPNGELIKITFYHNFPNKNSHFLDFDVNGADLVRKLFKLNPLDRLGATDSKAELYNSIRRHEFFAGINFDLLFSTIPPTLTRDT